MKHITSKLLSLLLTLAMLLSMVPAAYAADGESGEESAGEYAAKSGSNQWTTLQEAINEATAADIYLAKDVTEEVTIPAGKTVNLILYGHKLDGSITNNGTLKVQKGWEDTGLVGGGSVAITNNGTLTLDNVRVADFSVTNNGTLNFLAGTVFKTANITNSENGTIVIKGGTFTGEPNAEWLYPGYIAKLQNDGSYKVSQMSDTDAVKLGYVAKSAATPQTYYKTLQDAISAETTVNIITDVTEDCTKENGDISLFLVNNCKFTGSLKCAGSITVQNGTVELTDVECKSFTAKSPSWSYSTNVTIKNGSVGNVTVEKTAYNGIRVEIKDGNYTGNVSAVDEDTLSISGGTFSSNVSAYVAEGYTYDPETGTVKPDTTEPTGVARIGNAYYATLEAAIKATKTGDTVTLLQNVDLGTNSIKFYNSGVENLTFDLGGHKITSAVKDNGTVIASRMGLVIKNGTIENTSTGSKDATSAIYVTGGGTTTLENVTLVSNKSGLYVCNSITNTASVTVNIGKGTVTNGTEFGVFIEGQIKGSGTKLPQITLNINGGTINGAKDGVKVTSNSKPSTVKTNITGGTVSSVNIISLRSTYPATLEISGGTVEGTLTCNGPSEITVKDGIFNGEVKMLDTTGTITISGGTFAVKPSQSFCANGYVPTVNEDGTYTVQKADMAAEVGGTGYATLAEAIKAAKGGDTVTLLDDITLTSAQSISKQLTLDLNGKTITSTAANTIKLVAGADLTVKDSAAGGKIANTNSRDAQTIYLSAANTTFTLESGTIESTPNVTSIYSVAIANATKKACTVNINGGNVVTPEAAKDGRAIVAYNGMTLNISGGTITGGLHGVDAYSGSTVNITGGTISARYKDTGLIKEAYGMQIKGTANVTINGGEIQGIKMDDDGYNLNVPNVTLVSGNITGSFYSITKGTIVFTVDPTAGIILANDTASAFLPEGVKLTQNTDGTYGVTKATAYVAKIADKGQYETLEAAFAAAVDGDTITLLSNCSGNGIVVEESAFLRGLTVDFAGYTYTVSDQLVGSNNSETNGFQLKKGNKITFTNGTITSADTCTGKMSGNRVWTGAAAILLQNYCDLTLDGMTVTGGNATCYTMSNNNGKTFIKDSTIIAGKNTNNVSGPFAFDVCGYSSYDGVSVTVTGNSTINGDIEVSRSSTNAKDVKLALKGGTITGELKIDSSIKSGDATTVTKSSDVTLAAPDGYLWVAGDDSTSTLAKAVAQIGDKQYASLQAAFDEAKTGDTVTLLDDITLTEQVNITKALNGLTLDGNGKTITCATTTDPFQSGGSALYFGNAGDKLYCTGIKIKDLTMTGTARFAIFLCGGTTTEFTNVNISGNYYIGINLYGTHGATMTNCNISNSTTGTDKYISAIWSNVSSANPLELVNTKVNTIAINAYTTDNKLEPKIYVKDGSEVGEIHTFDDGSVSGDKKLCVSPTSTGTYTIKEYDETNSEWIDIKDYVAEYNGTKYESLQDAIDAASQRNGSQTEVKLLTNVTITETVVFAKKYIDGSVLLDLGGYTLTGKNCRAIQVNKGNLYLENGTVTSTGIVNSSSVIRIGSNEDAYSGISPMLYMRNSAKVFAPESYGVTIFGSATRGEKLKVMSNAEIIATGPSPAISGNGGANYNTDDRTSGWKAEEIIIGENAVISAANNYAIYHPECGTLSIQGGTISGKGGIQMCSGTLKISGSPTITAIGKAEFETGGSGPIYDEAAISVVNRSYPQGPATVTIKGTPTITTVDGEIGEVIHAFSWDNTTKTESEWADAGNYINVSGGTYSKKFDEAYLAADCSLVTSSDGRYTVEQKPVAEYNGTQYTSLAQAFTDARNSGEKATVKLLADVKVTTSLDISSPQGVTLNLNKKTLTLAGGAQLYTSKTATINNGTIKRIDEPTSGNARDFAIYMLDGSSLMLGAGTGSTYKVTLESTYGIYNVGGTLNVRYATITTDGWSIAVSDSASKTGVVYIGRGMGGNTKTVITSESGNVLGTMVNSKPNVTIDYGTLTSNGTAWDAGVVYWASEGTLTITGGIFNASSAESSTAAAVYQKNGTVKISGATTKLLGNNALVVKAGDGSTGTMVTELSGGKYSTKPDEAWVVEGKEIHETDGLYVVEGPYVVEVTLEDGTTTKFDSWSNAFTGNYAQYNNATVTLLKNIETSPVVKTFATVTIDFNGHTLTVEQPENTAETAAITLLASSARGTAHVTLKDSSEAANGGMKTVNVYGVTVKGSNTTLTIENGNYNCDTSVVQVEKPVSGVATAYIKGGTFQTEDTDKSYLLNCIDVAYKAGTAVMEVTGGTFYGFDPSAKPEGEGTTYVKVGYVVKGNDGVYTVEKSDKDAAMFDADGKLLGYEDVANAVNDPKAVTIKLIKNATANGVVLLGKTLDLNGFTLTTLYVAAFDKGNLIDSKEGEGLLKFTGTSSLSLCKDNSYLPLYDKSEQGYRFFNYRFETYTVVNNGNVRKFWFKMVFDGDKAYQLLKESGHGMEIRVAFAVGSNEPLETTAPQDVISKWANLVIDGTNPEKAGFSMNVKGFDKLADGTTVTVTGYALSCNVRADASGSLTSTK